MEEYECRNIYMYKSLLLKIFGLKLVILTNKHYIKNGSQMLYLSIDSLMLDINMKI